MRSNLTASMFDLSMKDKSRSTFGKLKDKLKGKRSSGLSDTVSAIVPSITHSIADSEDESAEKEKEKKKFKIKTLFSKPGLQKSSLSQSMSALPAVQPVTEKVKLRPGDFKSSWYDNDDDEEDEKTLTPVSEKNFDGKAEDTTLHPPAITAYKKTASVDKQLNQAASSSTKKEGLSLFGGLKSKNDPVSRSNVCINGSHVYMEECEAMPKDSTPSSSPSPQTFRKKHLYASEENLSSKSVKGPEELEKTNRALSGSSSLETFKSLTLPSYKLLSGGDSIESSVSSSADSTKETKKPALLSLVTGKKELGKNTDVEKLTDVTVKEKDVKGPENQKNESEAKPVEVPTALPRESPSESSSTAYIPRNKQSLNPFGEEQKPEKPVASARTNQTKVVKPRLGVSSEDETEATLATSAPDCLPAFTAAHHASSTNNPFASKMGQNFSVQTSESISSPLVSLSALQSSGKNPFTPNWGQESKAQDSPSSANSSHPFSASVPKSVLSARLTKNDSNPFTFKGGQDSQKDDFGRSCSPPLYFSHPAPAVLVHGSSSLPSVYHANDNNPFTSEAGQELEAVTSLASPFPPCAASSIRSSTVEHPASSECSSVSSDKPQNESVAGNANTVPKSLGLPSDSSVSQYERVEATPRKQGGGKGVQIESAFKKNNKGKKKSLTFSLDLEDTCIGNSDEDSDRECPDQCEEVTATGEIVTAERAGFASARNTVHVLSPEPCDEQVNSHQNSKRAVCGDMETGNASAETCMGESKEFTSLPKSNSNLSSGNAVVQASSATSKINEELETISEEKRIRSLGMGEQKPIFKSVASPVAEGDLSDQVEPPKPTPRVRTLLSMEAGKAGDVSELSPLFVTPKPAPRNAARKPKCASDSQPSIAKEKEMLSSERTKMASGDVLCRERPSDPSENLLSESSLKTAATSAVFSLEGVASNDECLKCSPDQHDMSLLDLKSAVPVLGDGSAKPLGLPVIPEVGSDDEQLDDNQKGSDVSAPGNSLPKTESDPLQFTEEIKQSSSTNSFAEKIPRVLHKTEENPEDTGESVESSRLTSVDIFCANSKAGLDAEVSYSKKCGCDFEEGGSINTEEGAGGNVLKPPVSPHSLSNSSQPLSYSQSLQSGTCNSNKAETPRKPTAEGFDDKAESAGKKKLLQAWVSPSETHPNQTQRSGGAVFTKHRPHPVKPMNTTPKSFSITSSVTEKRTEINPKKYDPSDPAYAYAQLTHDELIQLVLKQKNVITKRDLQVRELEDYIDNLLVRVMEETPNILRVSSQINKKAGRM
ncbi:rab11 family-interacting protein 1 isoform X2 [Alligator mississippiensis]|nr:rab11 family-interacting protein 1 isoform X2 [Alligator mississippiensis]XP_019346988.1 rab11 family-interacting protein 1 isoform X2 [Alligator mississippiensis]XP_019346990.1 rab11 family-interacting protein 1 isoform X2 [Alligator mississippiensis]